MEVFRPGFSMWKHIKWLNKPPVNISNSEWQNIPYNKKKKKKVSIYFGECITRSTLTKTKKVFWGNKSLY